MLELLRISAGRGALRGVLAAGVALVAGAASSRAQTPVLLQGILDGEAWSTNATSNLLTRNRGQFAPLGRLDVWGAVEAWRGLVFYAEGEAEAGAARVDTASYDLYSNRFGVQYTAAHAFVVDVGRLTPVIGTFASRHFSTRNPLIGQPDGYTAGYPLGVELSGETSHFDYRAAMVSLPTTHTNYQPKPTPELRPAIGAGVTPFVGLRIGGSLTMGPYLNRGIASNELFGKRWNGYQQTVIAADFAYAIGYLETHAEAARGSYDIPGRTAIAGVTYYGEAKYTLTPRFFLATRIERNDYPFIRPSTTVWVARLVDFADAEVGGGYRLGASTLLKVSVRADRWWVPPNSGFRGTGGHAVAMQFSQAFDVMNWVERMKQ
jgi:hypothetical protein